MTKQKTVNINTKASKAKAKKARAVQYAKAKKELQSATVKLRDYLDDGEFAEDTTEFLNGVKAELGIPDEPTIVTPDQVLAHFHGKGVTRAMVIVAMEDGSMTTAISTMNRDQALWMMEWSLKSFWNDTLPKR